MNTLIIIRGNESESEEVAKLLFLGTLATGRSSAIADNCLSLCEINSFLKNKTSYTVIKKSRPDSVLTGRGVCGEKLKVININLA